MSKTKKAATIFFAAAFFALAVMGFSRSFAYDVSSEEYTAVSYEKGKMLIAAGVPFGVRLHTDGVIIVNLTKVVSENSSASPGSDAGLRKGDVIISVNGEKINSAKSLCEAVEKSGGKEMTVLIMRSGKEKNINVKAVADKGGVYKIGVLARDSAAGIGTVTFIDPETGIFAGLGHGICDPESGELVPLSYGSCEDVVLTDIIKGKCGSPGELRGFFSGKKTGKITVNSYSGIVGLLSEIPSEIKDFVFPACGRGKLHTGKAYIYTTVDGGGRAEYEVNISSLDENGGQKNFTVEITDKNLLEKTGGIVQGMSGSPVVQDGYLVGAVTHVMVSDPTRGYGILIENMLSEITLSDGIMTAA